MIYIYISYIYYYVYMIQKFPHQPGLTFSTKAIATSSFEACSSDSSPISPFLPGMGSRPSSLAATSRSFSEVLLMTWMKRGLHFLDFKSLPSWPGKKGDSTLVHT